MRDAVEEGANIEELVELLDVDLVDVDTFRGGHLQNETPLVERVFGGQVAAQALVAASRTVAADRFVHSLHAYFLRPGDRRIPILYEVDRIRDGRSFATRRVIATQDGREIFNLQASFQVVEDGYDHQVPMPDVPKPDALPRFAQRLREHDVPWPGPQHIDVRHVEDPLAPGARRTTQHVWLRADGRLPDDPILHACVATYASDLTLLDSALLPFGDTFVERVLQQASLDHAMWFHRPFRADDWLLYAQRTPSAWGGRGLASGSLFTADGQLAVHVVQEGVIRKVAS